MQELISWDEDRGAGLSDTSHTVAGGGLEQMCDEATEAKLEQSWKTKEGKKHFHEKCDYLIF